MDEMEKSTEKSIVSSTIVSSYRSTNVENSSSDDDNSDDSTDESEIPWKRRKTPINKETQLPPVNSENNPSMKRKNNIWAAVLSEQSLSESVGGFCMRKKMAGDDARSVESYDFRSKFELDGETPVPPPVPKLSRIQKRRHRETRQRFYYRDNEPDDDVAARIAARLNEPKMELIGRVVEEVGKKLAVELLYKTEEIESAGGMLVLNCTRRRTPGGVYLQLLRESPTVLAHQLDNIFKEERKYADKKKKKYRAMKRRMQTKTSITTEIPLPSVLDVALSKSTPKESELSETDPSDENVSKEEMII